MITNFNFFSFVYSNNADNENKVQQNVKKLFHLSFSYNAPNQTRFQRKFFRIPCVGIELPADKLPKEDC